MKFRWFILCLLLSVACPPGVHAGERERVAVTLDVQGEVMLISELNGFEDESPLLRTNHLSVGDRVTIPAGGAVTLMHLESFKRFLIRGPNMAVVEAAGFKLKKGVAKPLANQDQAVGLLATLGKERKNFNLPEVVVGIRDLNKKVGGIVLLSPVDKERLLAERPEFVWHPREDLSDYRLIIKGDAGEIVLDTPVAGTPFRLPAAVTLQPGGHYYWQVVAGKEGEAAQSIPWSFVVLSPAERAELQQWRPAAKAPISDHVLYALLLEKMGVLQEAKAEWQRLHERDPADPLFSKKAK
ncbi:MAG: hypothetical protein HQL90_13500 [Magnetococcales bacterium]|nr:hypothetical protein [Magnetococcales bacterium]